MLFSSNHFTVTIRGSNTEGSKKMSEPENVCMMHIYDKIFQIPITKSTFPLSLSKLVVVIPQESPITYKTLEYLKVEGKAITKMFFCRIKSL